MYINRNRHKIIMGICTDKDPNFTAHQVLRPERGRLHHETRDVDGDIRDLRDAGRAGHAIRDQQPGGQVLPKDGREQGRRGDQRRVYERL